MRTADEVLTAYRSAITAQDADALAELYSVDGVHRIPFAFPGLPAAFEGREAVRAGYRTLWGQSRARPEFVAELAVHRDACSGVVVAEQSVIGTLDGTGEGFEVRGVLVLVVADGQIIEARDYLDAGQFASDHPRTERTSRQARPLADESSSMSGNV